MELDNNSSDDSSTYDTSDPLLHKIFFAKYKTILKLGQGSFGKIYKAEYNNDYYALKFEDRNECLKDINEYIIKHPKEFIK